MSSKIWGRGLITITLITVGVRLSAETSRGALTVSIRGLDSDAGALAVALFDSEDAYVLRNNPVRRAFVPIAAGKGTWILDSVPYGEYVVITYHDENGNGELDTRIFGIPKEKVGISNNVRGSFGPPSFDKAKFRVSAARVEIEIVLQ